MLLPLDLLVRIADGDANLPGLTPDAYHLRSGERLNEAASRAWTQCKAAWDSFRRKLAALPASDSGTTLTRNEWLLPLFQELDYGRLQPKPAIVIDEKTYPVSHRWEEHVPIHLLSAKIPLDKRTAGVDGAATRSPYSMVQELLNRSGKFRWGMVSNGLKLYLLRDNNSLSRAANVEFDLEAMMDGEVYADFMLLWLLCHQSRVEILSTGVGGQGSGIGEEQVSGAGGQGPGKKAKGKGKAGGKAAKSANRKTGKLLIADDDEENLELDLESDDSDSLDEVDSLAIPPDPRSLTPDPSSCWLERWTKEAESRGTRAREKLRSGVENAINALGAGFLETRGNEQLKQRLTTGTLDKQDYYRQLLRMVYRLLLLLVAEEKKDENGQNLLHPLGTSEAVRQRYAKFYSVGRLRDLAGLRRGTSHTDLFESLKVLFEKLREGYEPLGIPGLGSFLFSTTATPDLDNAHLSNVAILECFRHLSYTDDVSKSRRVVDFGNLGSEELGSVYESLLELHPKINSDKGPFVLDSAAGSERKTTGSYYTPTSLINCLLDSALDPVVNDAINVSDLSEAERRLLNLKVCDPACGSGHFLIAAAERLAVHLARLRTGDDQPPTMVVQHAKRDIIGRCIYGVDLNPMAVELCKVSLWMEALDPGRPLSFLDHHIQCGNSLLGTTPALLEKGIPDEAFTAIEGDVKAVCSDLKKQNKKQREDRAKGQGRFEFEPFIKLGNLPSEFTRLSSTSDDSVADVAEKERRYAELVSGADYQNARLLADTWCAVFVWQKDTSDLGKLCPTENDFRRIENNPHSILPHVMSEVRRLADQYQFFHWHLAFPDVFRLPGDGEAENQQMGWNAGFDVMLGNPPWERVVLKEKEFFATRAPRIAEAKTAASRRKLIAALENSDPSLYTEFKEAHRKGEGESQLLRVSGTFPLCGNGRDINSAFVFCELASNLVGEHGRVGVIVPSAIVTDHAGKLFFKQVVETRRLVHAFDFENSKPIFVGVHRSYKFALICLAGLAGSNEAADFVFFLTDTTQIADDSRHFTLTAVEIAAISPNTRTCPVFRTAGDAELAKAVYRRLPILTEESKGANNEWQIKTRPGLFHTANDSSYFRGRDALHEQGFERDGIRFVSSDGSMLPLYESKMVHHFDHRWFSFDTPEESDHERLQRYEDPYGFAFPRYWVSESEVMRRAEQNATQFLVRKITNATNERTVISSLIPKFGIADSGTLVVADDEDSIQLAAALNSFALDFFARQKIAGSNLNPYILRQFPVPTRAMLDATSFVGASSTREWIRTSVLELTYTAWDLEAFALDCGYDGPPFRWDVERRLLLRCELDAAYFHLYLGESEEWGNDSPQLREMFPTPRHAVEYIMETFPIVKRKDIKRTTITDENGQVTQPGTYITKDTILSIYDAMTESIRTGTPYQTRLDPPPGPPTDTDGNFIPYTEWTAELNTSHIHQPRVDRPRTDRKRVEKGRLVLDLLLLLEAWGQPVSITALEPALLLMRNEVARKTLLKQQTTASEKSTLRAEPQFIAGIDVFYRTVEANGAIRPVGDNGYELAKPELLKGASTADRARATEVVQAVAQLRDLRNLADVVAELTDERYEITV